VFEVVPAKVILQILSAMLLEKTVVVHSNSKRLCSHAL
jgi:hypothetical protein